MKWCKKSRQKRRNGLDQLSTYGILKRQGAGFLNRLMRSLTEAGLVQTVTSGDYPLLTLTDRGDQAMRGEVDYELVWPESKPTTANVDLEDRGLDGELYSLLRDLRAKLAKQKQVPPYVIFNNKTLEAIARYQPTTEQEALQLPGIGETKLQRHGGPFLETVQMWRDSR